jgi:hypothetical protein
MQAVDRKASRPSALATGNDVRMARRTGAFAGHTTGLAHGFVQGNLTFLPRDGAEDFLRFCTANPKSCPVLGVSDPGSPRIASPRSAPPCRAAGCGGTGWGGTPEWCATWRACRRGYCQLRNRSARLHSGLFDDRRRLGGGQEFEQRPA